MTKVQGPAGGPNELFVGCDRAGLRHAGQAKIGGVGQYRGQDHPAILERKAGSKMGEAVTEAGPCRDLAEQVGDANLGQKSIQAVGEKFGRLRRHSLEWGYFVTSFGEFTCASLGPSR